MSCPIIPLQYSVLFTQFDGKVNQVKKIRSHDRTWLGLVFAFQIIICLCCQGIKSLLLSLFWTKMCGTLEDFTGFRRTDSECYGENPACEHFSDGSLLLHVAFEHFMRTVSMIWHITVNLSSFCYPDYWVELWWKICLTAFQSHTSLHVCQIIICSPYPLAWHMKAIV